MLLGHVTDYATAQLLAQSTPDKKTASLGFHVVDVYGKIQPYRVLNFVQLSDDHRDFSDRFQSLRADGIPYGEYSYRLQRTDIAEIGVLQGTLRVAWSQVWRTVVFHGGPVVVYRGRPSQADISIPAGIVISGLIRPHAKSDRNRWVRIQALYEPITFETPVDEHGEFRLEYYIEGNYLLLVFEDGNLLYSAPVTFNIGRTSPNSINIDLGKAAPSVITVR